MSDTLMMWDSYRVKRLPCTSVKIQLISFEETQLELYSVQESTQARVSNSEISL